MDIRQHSPVFRMHHGAGGHFQHQIGAGGSGHVFVETVGAPLRLVVPLVLEVQQGGEALVPYQDDTAAVAAVAAGGTAQGNVFFPPEGHRAVAAVAGFYIDFCVISKHISSPSHLAYIIHFIEGLRQLHY